MNEIAERLARKLFDRKLIANEYRSAFVEAMIEPYLQKYGWVYVGDGWYGWDFERGETRLELKQSAATQTWHVRDGARYRGSFDIAPRTGYYLKDGKTFESVAGRSAHTYVFAWHGVEGEQADHRDPAYWEFYVVPANELPDGQKSISLSRVRKLATPVALDDLAATVQARTPDRP